jgi:eukaryotic-like serine/threonine-protein kinase
METSSAHFRPGEVLLERYKLEKRIGDGGMGQVWSAVRVGNQETVALKILHSQLRESESQVRFEREARLMTKLGAMSEHITKVFEHGVLDSGEPYLVMECLIGEGLDTLLKRERILPFLTMVEIIAQLARGLEVAHREGVIHRDLKPANIFLEKKGADDIIVKLLDFGVAKAIVDFGEQTQAGTVIGTPNYMAPEQLTGQFSVDHRADLFALGSIAYRCASGTTAFGKGNLTQMASKILKEMPAPPTQLNPKLPMQFDRFIEKALAKKPAHRFQTAREFAESLENLASTYIEESGGFQSLPDGSPVSNNPSARGQSLQPASTGTSVEGEPEKSPLVRILVVLLIILAVIAGAAIFMLMKDHPVR